MAEIHVGDNDTINPIGQVISSRQPAGDAPFRGCPAIIRVEPQYETALLRISEHSHLWILSWFHLADRAVMRVAPSRINKDIPEFGVFGLRTPARPNPISLTLVRLEKVAGLDRPDEYKMRNEVFRKMALAHHGEECLGLELGIKMALLVDERFGKIESPDLTYAVTGDGCLADVLQGLTRARLANPGRFTYCPGEDRTEVRWFKNGRTMWIKVRPDIDAEVARQAPAAELFDVEAN